MDTVHQNQHTLPLPQHRERLHSKRRKKIRHWRRKQRKINSGLANKNASDLSTSSDSDSGIVQFSLKVLWYTSPMCHQLQRYISYAIIYSSSKFLNIYEMPQRKIWLELTTGGSCNRYRQRKDEKY